jgi:S-adenosylmethionine hydrolase
MPIITLTTDFGEKDFYVAAFKGEILSACPSVQIVDITNNIPPFEIRHAAYVLKNAFTHFPKKTIHVARVFEMSEAEPRIIACSYMDHFFIAPDNGMLSMVFDGSPSAAVTVDQERMKPRSPHDVYTRAVKTLVYNGSLSDLGMPVDTINEKLMLRPVIQGSSLRGIIRHVDYYGNAITNITRDDFNASVGGSSFMLLFRRHDMITRLHSNYSDVPQGEYLARFNSKSMLEIAVNCGRANELLGLREGDNIKIEY